MDSGEIKTFVFTDIVDSTSLKAEMPGKTSTERDNCFVKEILQPHRLLIQSSLSEYGGRLVNILGDGCFLVFGSPILATEWAISVQQAHVKDVVSTPAGDSVGVKIGIHMGKASRDPSDPENFIGKNVDTTARIVDFGTSGQILVSSAVYNVVETEVIFGIRFHAHGRRELKGVGSRRIYEVLYDDQAPSSLKGEDYVTDASSASIEPSGGNSAESPLPGSSGIVIKTADVKEGVMLGKYALEKKIGGGGMGDVYLARHVGMNRECVVKVIKDHLLKSKDLQVIDRFYREVQLVANLKHANVVSAYDSSGRGDPVHYLAMEYVRGVSMDHLIVRHGQLPVAAVCEIVRQAACGLQYVHERGLIHRDVKPSNLMLAKDRDGAIVKILDLGIALVADESVDRLTDLRHRGLGTDYYMAPEQWKTTSVDIRADIYSLGCTFYHLLTGRPPFLGSNFTQEYAHHTVDVPKLPKELGVPRDVQSALQKMLAKQPGDRFAEPVDVVEAMSPFADLAQLSGIEMADAGADTGSGAKTPTQLGSSDPDRETTRQPTIHDKSSSLTSPCRAPRSFYKRPKVLASVGILVTAAILAAVFLGPKQELPQADMLRAELGATPGINGGWWFEETPWYLPGVRARVLDAISSGQAKVGGVELHPLAEKLRSGDYPAARADLQQIADSVRPELSGLEKTLLNELFLPKDGFEEFEYDKLHEVLASILDSANEDSDGVSLAATALHTRALLVHRLWLWNSSRYKWEDANDLYLDAIEAYSQHNDDQNRNALLAICRLDLGRLRAKSLPKADEKKSMNLDVLELISTPSLFAIAARCVQADALRSRGTEYYGRAYTVLNEAEVDADEMSAPRVGDEHPLRDMILERRAWLAMEQWKFSDAHEMFVKAADSRRKKFANNSLAWNFALFDYQGQAMALHFKGNCAAAETIYQEAIKGTDSDNRSISQTDLTKLRVSENKRRRPNLYERQAEVFLFGPSADAMRAADLLEMGIEQAENEDFDQSPFWSYIGRLRYKRAIALALANQAKKADELWNDQNGFEDRKKAKGEVSDLDMKRYQKAKAVASEIIKLYGADDTRRNAGITALGTMLKEYDHKKISRKNIQFLLLAAEAILKSEIATQEQQVFAARRLRVLTEEPRRAISEADGTFTSRFLARYFSAAQDSLRSHLDDPELEQESKKESKEELARIKKLLQ